METEGIPGQITELRDLHTGDAARVTTGERVLDPAEVIAVWPWTQEDFTPDRHTEDIHIHVSKQKDMTVDSPVWKEVRRPRRNGYRVTLATENSGRYAMVDWAHTDDPPILYLLLIESEDPEERRWDRLETVTGVERLGSVQDCSPPWCWCTPTKPSDDIPPWVVEQDAEPSFKFGGAS